jgi:hypothetical protein
LPSRLLVIFVVPPVSVPLAGPKSALTLLQADAGGRNRLSTLPAAVSARRIARSKARWPISPVGNRAANLRKRHSSVGTTSSGFEAADERYALLNRIVAVGHAENRPAGAVHSFYSFYEVL